MTLTILLCLLFFFGYLALSRHWQALAFLALGAGYQLMSAAFPGPGSETADRTALLLVCIFSISGYIGWRSTRRFLPAAPFGRERLLVFLGWGGNAALLVFILWLTGMITFPV